MKKLFIGTLISMVGFAANAQTTKAIFIHPDNGAQIGDFNPATAVQGDNQSIGTVFTIPRDFIYDSKNENAIFQNSSTALVFCKLNGNQMISTKTLSQSNTVMAPSYLPAEGKVACFKVEKQFNGYGSNEENLSFSTIDVRNGITKSMLKFSDISFDNVSAPYYGNVKVLDRFTGVTAPKDVAISKPLYIAEKSMYIIMIRDVTGTNRLYKIKIITQADNTQTANLVSSNHCDYNLIDMSYMYGDMVKALYFEKSGSQYLLKVGDFDITTNSMTNSSVIKSFNKINDVLVDNGSIKFNSDHSNLYVSQFNGNSTGIYSLDLNSNQSTVGYKEFSGNVQFDFGFSESSYVKSPTYVNTFKLYPNPSNGEVNFRNQSGLIPNGIEVYDNIGKLVKSIRVEDSSENIKFDISNMAPGIYTVRVDLPGSSDFVGKVAVTK